MAKGQEAYNSLKFTREEFLLAVKNSKSHKDALKILGYKVTSVDKESRYKKFFNELNPDISHFSLKSRHGGKNKISGSIEAFRNRYIDNAKPRNLEFSLSITDFTKLVTSTCYYCGNKGDSCTGPKRINLYCGIDRIDNNKGYTIDNCVSCCKRCNWMKNKTNKKDFLNQIKRIYENLELGKNNGIC